MSEPILSVKGLEKHFGGISATQNLNFDLEAGAKEAIIGPNGAGKSTLFNLLTGFHRPDAGKIRFDGKDITGWPAHKIAQHGISRAFQISNIFRRLTVFENVRTAVHAHTGKTANLFARADAIGGNRTRELLVLCGLEEKGSIMAGTLSQGDKKKLELAIALAAEPKLLLLDEPTAGMSLDETQETMALVDRLNETSGVTILFTEHDMLVVFNHANQIMLLHRGEIIVRGRPDEIRNNEQVQRIYLGESQ
jgi:branched-chain amino acid transport system ATP-binding protein